MNKEVKSLYRVYRPKTFAEVIGQHHITQTIQNQIASGKIAHAYLFCGTRGTGKTTVAKIFAREVNKANQKNGVSPEVDIFEIDAASNNSVQDVRELIEKVKYPPILSKYKVYIIDEVHMFSGSAFNAFLKTLEEPPSHVIFILCTTEPHKLLPTVQSRCLRFDFRTASVQDIKKALERVFKNEKIFAESEAVELLAESGSGSFRDALSFAETVISYCGENKITQQDVCEIIGTIEKKILNQMLDAILESKAIEISKVCKQVFSKGVNTAVLVKDFLSNIRQKFIETQNKRLLEIYKIFAELEMNIKNATDASKMFEGACFVALC